jgi:hypothetical protein
MYAMACRCHPHNIRRADAMRHKAFVAAFEQEKVSPADDDARDLEEGLVDVVALIAADLQPPEPVDVRDGLLDDVAGGPQPAAVRRVAA